MRFNILAGLAFLASAVAANPILKPRQDFNTSQPFHLKTAGASNPEHNDLYVYGYHTGAGFNDAVLSSDSSIANKAILNNTRVQFLLGTDFPWGFTMGGATNYAGESSSFYRLICPRDQILRFSFCSVGNGGNRHGIRYSGFLHRCGLPAVECQWIRWLGW